MGCKFIKTIFWVGLLLVSNQLLAQQRVDERIPKNEQHKIEKAKKLFNNYKFFEGEQIIKDLIKQYPNDPYYYEALVQLQRQLLFQIKIASGELEKVAPKIANENDTTLLDEFGQAIEKKDSLKKEIKKTTLNDLGFDIDENKLKKKEKIDEDIHLTDAIVTIDSSLLQENETNGNDTLSHKLSKKDKVLKQQLKNLETLAQIPYESYKYNFIEHCRKATLQLDNVDSASFYLRNFLVDTIDNDILANDEAIELFEEGIEAYYEKNIPAATKRFEKAVALYPTFYKARLFLGDCYMLLNTDTAAIRQYFLASEINPDLPDAFERMAHAFYDIGQYDNAASQIIEAILVYPQDHYFTFLKRIVLKTGKEFSTQWLPREVFPLTTKQNFEEIIAKEKTPWWHYQNVKQDVYGYYDTAGFVRPNEKTNEPYLEIYGWKKMLSNSGRQHFQFARAMEKLGYLECYVFLTLFHHDIYSQYKDFIKKNPEKVRNYFTILINWDSKKFDKLRKEFFTTNTTKDIPKEKTLNSK